MTTPAGVVTCTRTRDVEVTTWRGSHDPGIREASAAAPPGRGARWSSGVRLALSSPRYGAAVEAPVVAPARTLTGPVVAWSLWDWGSAAFNAVITTFVFTRWLTSDAFVDPAVVAAAGDGGAGQAALDSVLAQHSSWLGWGLAAAGLVVALLAPVLGTRADATGRRRRALGLHTGVVFLVCVVMALVSPAPGALTRNLLLGIALLAVGNVFFELASVNYNAMLPGISTPRTIGTVSGIGWGAGYIGGIVLLAVLYVGFIAPEVGWFGVTADNGADVRASVLLAALWFGVFALPVLLKVPDPPGAGSGRRPSLPAAYAKLGRHLATLWRTDRHLLAFLVASAVFRDGLAGVFTFGAVIASGTFGFSASEVLVFAIAANVVAGVATVAAGYLDDRLGAKAVIVMSLVGLLVSGIAVFVLHDAGQGAFWVFGLLLCLFVGPAQSASRSLLGRLAPAGKESEVYGLYATTGRAASFMAPLAFSTAIAVGGGQYWGILGIMVVLALGLVLLLPVRTRPAAPVVAG